MHRKRSTGIAHSRASSRRPASRGAQRKPSRCSGVASVTDSPPSMGGVMGYADLMRFDADAIALLAATEEIEIETAAPRGASHRTIIWVVVDGDDAFVRSVNGPTARWYREAVVDRAVTIHADGRALPARTVAAADG